MAGSDPLLLESVFNDQTLRGTNFVIVHGGGGYAAHAGAMLWKQNVYADMSLMTLVYTPQRLAGVRRPAGGQSLQAEIQPDGRRRRSPAGVEHAASPNVARSRVADLRSAWRAERTTGRVR